MDKKIQGVFTALVTPFKNGKVDFEALHRICLSQIEAKVDGLVFLGTTGESPTISPEERQLILEHAVKNYKGKTLLVCGTGSNDTKKTIEYTKDAKKMGFDLAMIVNPYYNKPTQEGLYRHFSSVCDSVDIPQILYNIEGRTSVNVQTKTLEKIARHSNLVAVKEASGKINQIMEVVQALGDKIQVLSGDDALTFPSICLGAKGVVSVVSNAFPKKIKELVTLALDGKTKEAKDLHYKLLKIFGVCFIETNPSPVKYILSQMGIGEEEVRLPLWTLSEDSKELIKSTLKTVNF